jgi:hypothetical protein
MKYWILSVALLSCVGTPVFAQNTEDTQTFKLTPSPPSTKYWLRCDPRQRLPGNAAFLYAEAAAMLNDAANKRIMDADDAYDAGANNFASLADAALDSNAMDVLGLLNVAAHRDHCDWDISVREQGFKTPLPLLIPLRELGKLIELRALGQIRNGQFDGAVDSLQSVYELGFKVDEGEELLSGLQSYGILDIAGSTTAELMKQPNSPNLYWALASFPHPIISLQHSFSTETTFLQASFHELAVDHLQELSGDDWRGIYRRVAAVNALPGPAPKIDEQTLAEQVTRTLPQAQDYYERTYNLTSEHVKRLDAFKVVATYWYAQERMQADMQYDMAALPYPILLEKAAELDRHITQMISDQPANIFLNILWTKLEQTATTWARLDRKLAGLTDVEAIRSYAAANDGKLPNQLASIKDTPVLDNPATGKPFNYTVQNETATLSDPEPESSPLIYTIQIRK